MKKDLLDLIDEIKELSSKVKLFDIFIPPLLFWLLVQFIDFIVAIVLIFFLTVLVGIYRLTKSDSLLYVIAGSLGVLITAVSSQLAGDALGVVLPDLITDGLIMIFSMGSLFFGIPFVALTSHIFRRWPREWYLHEKVKPAYLETTIFWIIFFLMRIVLKLTVVDENTASTVINNFLLGWPLTLGLLIFTYVYGLYRLRMLRGPSVEEFVQNKKASWRGQRKGF